MWLEGCVIFPFISVSCEDNRSSFPLCSVISSCGPNCRDSRARLLHSCLIEQKYSPKGAWFLKALSPLGYHGVAPLIGAELSL